MNVADWWGKGVFLFLWLSIFMLGVGRIELPFEGLSFSAWSISRTTFAFWLIWEIGYLDSTPRKPGGLGEKVTGHSADILCNSGDFSSTQFP